MWSAQSGGRHSRQAARGKEELLNTAARVIVDRGLVNTRFTDISDATGVAVSTLQYLFGSREDVLIAVIRHAIQEELQEIRRLGSTSSGPRERLINLISFILGERSGSEVFHLLWIEVRHGALHDPELKSLYVQRYDALRTVFRDTIQDGARQGLFDESLNAYDVAVQILALNDGLAMPLHFEEEEPDSGRTRRLLADVIGAILKTPISLSDIA